MQSSNWITLPPIHKLPALNLGLRKCSSEEWLDGDDAFSDGLMRKRQLAEKEDLISNQKGEIYACLPDAVEAEKEAITTLTEHLRIYHQFNTKAQKFDHLTSVCSHIPEDILIMLPTKKNNPDTDWILGAACLCFPSHWRLHDKIGQSITAIHDPVPDFGKVLARPVIKFFTNMQIGRLSQRLNWSVQTEDKLYTPRHNRTKFRAKTADQWGNIIHLRVEKQCFLKLPETGAVIFSIRTSLAPLNRFRKAPEFANAILQQAVKLSDTFRAYKNLNTTEKGLRIWVDKYLPQTK